MIVPRFNLGRSGLSLLLEGEIDQRKHNHRSNDHDGGVQQHKERSDHQATKHFPRVNLREKVHGVAKRRPPSKRGRVMESPAKDWSKLLTCRSTAVRTLCDAGSLMQNNVQ